MKKHLLALFAPLLLCGAGPVYEWNFQKTGSKPNYIQSVREEKQEYPFTGKLLLGGGIECTGKIEQRRIRFNADWSEFTANITFKLNSVQWNRTGNTLWTVMFHSYERNQITLQITPKSELEFSYILKSADGKKILRSNLLKTPPLKFSAGVPCTVSVTSAENGAVKIYLNGKLQASSPNQGVGLALPREAHKLPTAYPILTVGYNLKNPPSLARPLNGIVTHLQFEKGIHEPAAPADPASHLLISDTSGSEWTAPFQLPDQKKDVLAAYTKREEKFVRNAARAALEIKNGILTVKVDCPVPEGMKVEIRKSIWSGDTVEFFLCPDPSQSVVYQYAVGTGNQLFSARWDKPGKMDKTFKSEFKGKCETTAKGFLVTMEIPVKEFQCGNPASGTVMTGNINRSGKTSGGSSGWRLTGQSHNVPEAFGEFIFFSRKAYWMKKVANAEKELAALKGTPEQRADSEKALEAFRALAEKEGGNAKSFNALGAAQEKFRQAALQLFFAGRKMLIWQNDPYQNYVTPGVASRPLKNLSMIVPKNSQNITGFVISNLSDKPYLGQIKCLPDTQRKTLALFNRISNFPLCTALEFFQAVELKNPVGTGNFDPLCPLPLNTLISISPRSNAVVWVKVNSRKLAAGTYKGILVLKPAYDDFGMETVDFNVTVSPVDLGKILCDNMNYTYLHTRVDEPCQALRYLAESGKNYINMSVPGHPKLPIYPKLNKDGTIGPCDFSSADKRIDTYISCGMPLERIKLIFGLALDYGYGFPKRPANLGSPLFAKGYALWLKALTDHLKEKYQIGTDRIVFYPVDEPSGDIDDPKSTMHKAYISGKMIKAAGKQYRTMINPLPAQLKAGVAKQLPKLLDVFDIFEIYRPCYDKKLEKLLKKEGKEIWTYSILAKGTVPDVYRRDYWCNLRDNIESVAAYWNQDEHCGGDGFCGTDTGFYSANSTTDYGTLYCDYNSGLAMGSRRFEAHRQGFEDYKLGKLCRSLVKPGSPESKELEAIIAQGASGDIIVMEQCRLELLKFAEKRMK